MCALASGAEVAQLQDLGEATRHHDTDPFLHERRLLAVSREAIRAAREREAERRAQVAAQELNERAIWADGTVLLDQRLLLGDLLAHPTAKWICFEVNELAIVMSKQKLRAARPALRPFLDLAAYLDQQGLHFRWRGGRGGLDLFPHEVDRYERDRVFKVPLVLVPPEPVVVTATHAAASADPPPRHRRSRGGAWLGQILGDLGLLG